MYCKKEDITKYFREHCECFSIDSNERSADAEVMTEVYLLLKSKNMSVRAASKTLTELEKMLTRITTLD